MDDRPPTPKPRAADAFPSTMWSAIRLESGAPEAERAAAHATLAERYAQPILTYLRAAMRRNEHDARDLAQDFFSWMVETRFLEKADRDRGRFRAFIRTALKHYVADADRRARALRRGGAAGPASLDADDGPPEAADPRAARADDQLDAAWRRRLVEQALENLRGELRAGGRERMLAVFEDYYLCGEPQPAYRALAEKHGVSEADVSNYLQRSKARYRAALEAAVRETTADPDALAEELRWFFGEERG